MNDVLHEYRGSAIDLFVAHCELSRCALFVDRVTSFGLALFSLVEGTVQWDLGQARSRLYL